jgi:hypothetical protein
MERRIFLCKKEQVYIIKSYTHTYVVHFMKSGKDMEVHKSLVKSWYPDRKKKRPVPKAEPKKIKTNSQTSLDI